MINKPFETDIKDWTELSKDAAAFMLSQCSLVLIETLDTAKSITVRAEKILTFQITVGVSLLTYAIANYEKLFTFLPLTACIAIILICVGIFFAYLNFRYYSVAIPGELPKDIVRSKFVDGLEPDWQYLSLVINSCESIQKRIDCNNKENNKRISRNNKSLLCLALLLITPFLSLLCLWVYQ